MNLVFISSYRGRVLLVLVLAPVVTFSATLVQNAPPTPPDASSPVLIWDVKPNLDNSWPRNFRTTDDPLNTNEGQIPADSGLADLRASGGGEFTADGVKLLLAGTRGPLMRQETMCLSTDCLSAGLRRTTGRMSVALRRRPKQTRLHGCNRLNPEAKSLLPLEMQSKSLVLIRPRLDG